MGFTPNVPRFEPHPQPLNTRMMHALLERAGIQITGDDLRAAAAALHHTALSMTPRGADDAHRVTVQLHQLADLLE